MKLICLHTIKWFQVLRFDISHFIYQVFLFNINNEYPTVWCQITNNNNNNNNNP